MTTDVNCGQVRGPVQFAMSRSLDPIVSLEHSVTRCAVTTEKESDKQKGDNRTMGRKFTVPYGLYRVHGFINPSLAEQTGFNDEENGTAGDLDLFWQALEQMFEHDRSAARGEMSPQALFVFEHESKLGNAPAHKLFQLVDVRKSESLNGAPPRSFDDYTVKVDESGLPEGVKLHRRI